MVDFNFAWLEGERGILSPADYLVFGGMLAASLAIGIYYAIKSRKRSNDEFLLGGRSLSWFPVCFSLLATYVSSILILGGPSEAYYHGLEWWYICTGQVSVIFIAVVFLPFFYELKLTSVYEYLEDRYASRWVRSVAGGMFVVQMLLYQSVVIYTPGLAIASFTHIPLWTSILAVGLIATIYTTIGGIRAVVWTDVLQLSVLMIGFVVIIIKGVADVGSVQQVWEVAVKHNRAGPQAYTYGYDPLKRHTVANIIIGGIFLTAVQYGSSQTSVQRFASTKSLSQAYLSLVMMIPLFILAISLAIFAGLVIFATYEGCDPLAAGLIAHKDQILPFFVMDRLSSITGLPGLFIATLFSGSLSTISSGVNSQAAVTWEDVFAKIPSCASLSKRTQVWLTKLLAFGYGILAVGFAFLAGSLGGVLQAAIVVTSSVGGPLLGVFIMALFMPFTNSKGACGGMIFGTGIGLVFSFGSSITGVKLEMLPTSTEACPANFTIPPPPSTPPLRVSDLEFPEKILCLSYTQLGPLGTLMAIVIGVLISLATGRAGGRRIDKSLVHPWIRWTLPDPTTVTRKTNGHSYDKISTQL